jgi:hypothetical protein
LGRTAAAVTRPIVRRKADKSARGGREQNFS